MKMELVAKLKQLGNVHLEELVKFAAELPGSQSDVQENGTLKIRFDNFDGTTWAQVMDFADSLTKVETDMKRQKTEGANLPSHIVMNTCE